MRLNLLHESKQFVVAKCRPWGLKLSLIPDPFGFPDWIAMPGNWGLRDPITRDEIAAAISSGRSDKRPMQGHSPFDANRQYHIDRISFFAIHGFKNEEFIKSVQVSSYSEHGEKWPIVNGNHRVIAAKFLDWPTIPVWIMYDDPLIASDLSRLDPEVIKKWINQWSSS